jgi:hypothetical protein
LIVNGVKKPSLHRHGAMTLFSRDGRPCKGYENGVKRRFSNVRRWAPAGGSGFMALII